MAGTSLKCTKCGKIFRQIHGSKTEELSEMYDMSSEEKEKFKGDDFFCCGKEHLKGLHELGMMSEIQKLQVEWLNIISRIYEGR